MKKFFLIWAVLVLAAPAMADPNVVDVCAVPIGGDLVEIRYRVVSGQLPRAFALDITVSAGNIVNVSDFFSGECGDVNKGYGIFPASFNREIDADDPNWVDVNYTPVADVCDLPGDTQGGEGTEGVTIEMGSLYVDDNSPPTSGVLCVIQVSADCNIDLASNVGRGKVVLEDGTAIDPCFFHGQIAMAWDWGDAPDTPYPTLSTSNGARHLIKVLKMGALIDQEANGQPNADATGDDIAGAAPDDEDGVTLLVATPVGGSVTVTVNGNCKLNAWIDFNNNGSWADAGDQIFTNHALVAGANALQFAVPAGAVVETDLFSRWRVNNAGGLGYEGSAVNGEVEDYNQPYIVCHVPDVVDLPFADACDTILANGFTIGTVSNEFDDNIADGNVISTTPAYCNYPGCGTAVAIVVSKGPCVVPNVVGMDEASAIAAIEAAGFVAASNYMLHDTVPVMDVISQTPGPGVQPCGSTVTIDVSIGPCYVPNVVGLSEALALTSIDEAGLVGVVTGYEYHDTMPAGDVISQDQAPGSEPGCGTTVGIVVSLGPCVVPNVVGMTEAAAITAITDAGFTVGTKSYVNAPGVPLGDVASQNPGAGAQPCGTAVDIDVSAQCMKASTTPASVYTDWVAWGEPNCWCYEWQCRGDTDGLPMGPYRVGATDIALFRSAYLKTTAVLATITNGICADLDHLPMGPYRVGAADIAIFRTYYLKPGIPACSLSPNYNFWCVPGGSCP